MGPIVYQVKSRGPHWETLNFNPHFRDNLYFVYLNKKQNTQTSVKRYKDIDLDNKEEIVKSLNLISDAILDVTDLKQFEQLLFEHENLISTALDMPRAFDQIFSDYWGCVKSLGAWGGDFVLVTSDRTIEETQTYFSNKGFDTLIKFDDLILQQFQNFGAVNANEIEKINHVGSTAQ